MNRKIMKKTVIYSFLALIFSLSTPYKLDAKTSNANVSVQRELTIALLNNVEKILDQKTVKAIEKIDENFDQLEHNSFVPKKYLNKVKWPSVFSKLFNHVNVKRHFFKLKNPKYFNKIRDVLKEVDPKREYLFYGEKSHSAFTRAVHDFAGALSQREKSVLYQFAYELQGIMQLSTSEILELEKTTAMMARPHVFYALLYASVSRSYFKRPYLVYGNIGKTKRKYFIQGLRNASGVFDIDLPKDKKIEILFKGLNRVVSRKVLGLIYELNFKLKNIDRKYKIPAAHSNKLKWFVLFADIFKIQYLKFQYDRYFDRYYRELFKISRKGPSHKFYSVEESKKILQMKDAQRVAFFKKSPYFNYYHYLDYLDEIRDQISKISQDDKKELFKFAFLLKGIMGLSRKEVTLLEKNNIVIKKPWFYFALLYATSAEVEFQKKYKKHLVSGKSIGKYLLKNHLENENPLARRAFSLGHQSFNIPRLCFERETVLTSNALRLASGVKLEILKKQSTGSNYWKMGQDKLIESIIFARSFNLARKKIKDCNSWQDPFAPLDKIHWPYHNRLRKIWHNLVEMYENGNICLDGHYFTKRFLHLYRHRSNLISDIQDLESVLGITTAKKHKAFNKKDTGREDKDILAQFKKLYRPNANPTDLDYYKKLNDFLNGLPIFIAGVIKDKILEGQSKTKLTRFLKLYLENTIRAATEVSVLAHDYFKLNDITSRSVPDELQKLALKWAPKGIPGYFVVNSWKSTQNLLAQKLLRKCFLVTPHSPWETIKNSKFALLFDENTLKQMAVEGRIQSSLNELYFKYFESHFLLNYSYKGNEDKIDELLWEKKRLVNKLKYLTRDLLKEKELDIIVSSTYEKATRASRKYRKKLLENAKKRRDGEPWYETVYKSIPRTLEASWDLTVVNLVTYGSAIINWSWDEGVQNGADLLDGTRRFMNNYLGGSVLGTDEELVQRSLWQHAFAVNPLGQAGKGIGGVLQGLNEAYVQYNMWLHDITRDEYLDALEDDEDPFLLAGHYTFQGLKVYAVVAISLATGHYQGVAEAFPMMGSAFGMSLVGAIGEELIFADRQGNKYKWNWKRFRSVVKNTIDGTADCVVFMAILTKAGSAYAKFRAQHAIKAGINPHVAKLLGVKMGIRLTALVDILDAMADMESVAAAFNDIRGVKGLIGALLKLGVTIYDSKDSFVAGVPRAISKNTLCRKIKGKQIGITKRAFQAVASKVKSIQSAAKILTSPKKIRALLKSMSLQRASAKAKMAFLVKAGIPLKQVLALNRHGLLTNNVFNILNGEKITQYLCNKHRLTQPDSQTLKNSFTNFDIQSEFYNIYQLEVRENFNVPAVLKIVLALKEIQKADPNLSDGNITSLLKKEGFTKPETAMAQAIFSQDLFGDLISGRLSAERVFDLIIEKSKELNINALDYFKALTFLYVVLEKSKNDQGGHKLIKTFLGQLQPRNENYHKLYDLLAENDKRERTLVIENQKELTLDDLKNNLSLRQLVDLIHEGLEGPATEAPKKKGLKYYAYEWAKEVDLRALGIRGYRLYHFAKETNYGDHIKNLITMFSVSHTIEVLSGPVSIFIGKVLNLPNTFLVFFGTVGGIISIPGLDPVCITLSIAYSSSERFRGVIRKIRVGTVKTVSWIYRHLGLVILADKLFRTVKAKEWIFNGIGKFTKGNLKTISLGNFRIQNDMAVFPIYLKGEKSPYIEMVFAVKNEGEGLVLKKFKINHKHDLTKEQEGEVKKILSRFGFNIGNATKEMLDHRKSKRTLESIFYVGEVNEVGDIFEINLRYNLVFVGPKRKLRFIK